MGWDAESVRGDAVVTKGKRSRRSRSLSRSRSRSRSRSESKKRELRGRGLLPLCYVHLSVFIPMCGFEESILSPSDIYGACGGDCERA